MSDSNKENIQYFEAPSMRGLYEVMDSWQKSFKKRFLSVNVQKDGNSFCAIALMNPTEVVITSRNGSNHAKVDGHGQLHVMDMS